MEAKIIIGGNNHITSDQNINGIDRNGKGRNSAANINTNLSSSLSANNETSRDIIRKITSQVSNDIEVSSNNYKKENLLKLDSTETLIE